MTDLSVQTLGAVSAETELETHPVSGSCEAFAEVREAADVFRKPQLCVNSVVIVGRRTTCSL